MSLWPIAILAVQAGSGANLPNLVLLPRCTGQTSDDEVVVCGNRRNQYRLPLPSERPPLAATGGEGPSGTAALTPPGPCGIFAGQRRCLKREAAEFGYGQGRDPLTVAIKIMRKLTDPDTD